jgi:hypothetical protein
MVATQPANHQSTKPNQPTNQPNSQSDQARYRMPAWRELEIMFIRSKGNLKGRSDKKRS